MVEKVNIIVAIATIIGQILCLYGIFLLFKKGDDPHKTFIAKNGTILSFAIILGAFLGSIYYSSFVGYEPCTLCWWQRIFLFPQLIILFVAIQAKLKDSFVYTLPLSIVGGIFALYHTYIQYGGSELIPCGTDINSVSCAVRFVFEFGYITLPLMSLTTFVMLIIIALISKNNTNR